MIGGYKTVIFGVLLAAISVFSNTEMQGWIMENFEAVGGLTGVIVIVLRAITSSAIFKKAE